MTRHKKKTIKDKYKARGLYIYLTVLIVIAFAATLYINNLKNTMLIEAKQVEFKIDELEKKFDDIKQDRSESLLNTLETVTVVSQEPAKKEVIFSNYGIWDKSSGNKTASGMTISDFKVNEDGMYTYQNKVVLATANTERLARELKDGYNSHSLYDTVEFNLNDKQYQGIVIDVCGACYGVVGEDKQRYDIFTVQNSIGLAKGHIND